MVIHLEDGEEWSYSPGEGTGEVTFASASSVTRTTGRLSVLVNGEPFDYVTLSVPHSWWPLSGQRFCPPLHVGDTLALRCEAGPIAIRLDLVEHEA